MPVPSAWETPLPDDGFVRWEADSPAFVEVTVAEGGSPYQAHTAFALLTRAQFRALCEWGTAWLAQTDPPPKEE